MTKMHAYKLTPSNTGPDAFTVRGDVPLLDGRDAGKLRTIFVSSNSPVKPGHLAVVRRRGRFVVEKFGQANSPRFAAKIVTTHWEL